MLFNIRGCHTLGIHGQNLFLNWLILVVCLMPELLLELIFKPIDGSLRIALVRTVLDEKPLTLGYGVFADQIRCRCVYLQDRTLGLKATSSITSITSIA